MLNCSAILNTHNINTLYTNLFAGSRYAHKLSLVSSGYSDVRDNFVNFSDHLHEVDIHVQVENLESVSVGDQIIYQSTETIAVHLVIV